MVRLFSVRAVGLRATFRSTGNLLGASACRNLGNSVTDLFAPLSSAIDQLAAHPVQSVFAARGAVRVTYARRPCKQKT